MTTATICWVFHIGASPTLSHSVPTMALWGWRCHYYPHPSGLRKSGSLQVRWCFQGHVTMLAVWEASPLYHPSVSQEMACRPHTSKCVHYLPRPPPHPLPHSNLLIRWWWVGTVAAQEFAFQLGPQLIPTMSTFENQPTIPPNLPDTFSSKDRQGKEQFSFQFQMHLWHHHGQKKPSLFPLKICWITYTTLFSKSEKDKVVPVDWQGF